MSNANTERSGWFWRRGIGWLRSLCLVHGAFVPRSLPAAFYCSLRSPAHVEDTLLLAINAHHDADTVASMASTLAGALGPIMSQKDDSTSSVLRQAASVGPEIAEEASVT